VEGEALLTRSGSELPDLIPFVDEELGRMIGSGHAIGIHGYGHTSRSADYDEERYAAMQVRIETVTGQRTQLHRWPGGYLSTDETGNAPIVGAELIDYDWDIDSQDWRLTAGWTSYLEPDFDQRLEEAAAAIASNVITGIEEYESSLSPGEVPAPVILMHSINPGTPAALPAIIDYLLGAGYQLRALPRPGDSPDTPYHPCRSFPVSPQQTTFFPPPTNE
jgi:peptidoglycan/xylan/chitin deacetylase (PgdA/CDA1 family)